MSDDKEKSAFDWFKQIRNGERWIIMSILTLIISLFTTLGLFAYNNFSPPKDNARIESLEMRLDKFIENSKAKEVIQAAHETAMNKDIEYFKSSLETMQKDMKYGFQDMGHRLDGIVDIFKKNSK